MKLTDRIAAKWRMGLLLVICVLGSFSAGRAQQLILVGDPGSGTSVAEGINDSDQVVGYSATPTHATNAFLYAKGTMTNLGTLGGVTSQACGINNSGNVVGYSELPDLETNAFLYSAGTMTNLGTMDGGSVSYAYAINDAGLIAGSAQNPVITQTSSGDNNAFLYSEGTMTNLGTLAAGYSEAYGINNLGQIVGSSDGSAFLYSAGKMVSLEALAGYMGSQAFGINDSGQIVGNILISSSADGEHAFVYSGGTVTDLGLLGGNSTIATGINNSGQVVGYAALTSGGPADAFTYSAATGVQDLNTLYSSLLVSGNDSQVGFTHLSSANAINRYGDIVGVGNYYSGNYNSSTKAFLLVVPRPTADLFGGTVVNATTNYSSWFGYYTTGTYPLVYQYNLGYEYALGANGGVYLYDYTSGHFWYTQSSYFPFVYDFTLNAYLYYYQANTPHRHFYSYGTNAVITM